MAGATPRQTISVLLLALAASGPAAAGPLSTRQLELGTAGYTLQFDVIWTSDDSPGGTVSSMGVVELLDATGGVAGEVQATVISGSPCVSVTGPGTAQSTAFSVTLSGAGGTPANGSMSVVWDITGEPAGTYTLEFWAYTQRVGDSAATTITTTTLDRGGAANATPAPQPTPTPTPTPTPVPLYTLVAAASAGGSVSGGGSYPRNSVANVVATALPGYSFASWSGDITGTTPSVSVVMTSNVSVVALFSALLAQTISYVEPAGVSTRTPPFPLVATASSGLPVTLALESGPASLQGSVVTPQGNAGSVTVLATQPGNNAYLPASPVLITFEVGEPPAGVTFSDDSAPTKKSDRATRVTGLVSQTSH